MRILIVSDTHRHNETFHEIINTMDPFDLVIHCGDVEGSEHEIRKAAGCKTLIVAGNNDFFSDLPKEIETEIEGYKVLITHGHTYYVSMSEELIKEDARLRGFDIVCFGHTHRPLIDHSEGLVVINPGSLSYPRQSNRKPSFVIMEIDRFGEAHFTIRYL